MRLNDELLAIFEAETAEQLERMTLELDRDPAEWDISALFTVSHNLKGAAGFVDALPLADTAHALEELFTLVRKGRAQDNEMAALAHAGNEILQRSTGPATPELLADVDAFRAEVADYCARREAEDSKEITGTGLEEGRGKAKGKGKSKGRDGARRQTPRGNAAPAGEAGPPAIKAAPPPTATSPLAQEQTGGRKRPPTARAGEGGKGNSASTPRGGEHYTLRVGVDKLDRLMELAGELHATRFAMEELEERMSALVAQLIELERRGTPSPSAATGPASPTDSGTEFGRLAGTGFGLRRDFARITGRYETTVAQVQDSVRLLRMVPLSSVEGLLKKLVRDACLETGKEARFAIEGADTEIDRVVLDRLRDPLVHLLRNAVVHGIEPPEERFGAGKPLEGRIELRARTAGAWIEITVTDDGRGISEEGVRHRAIERGVITREQADAMSRAEIYDLIFQPGFSTAESVSQIAGRGVGLDIVRRNLVSVGGTVSVHRREDEGTEFRIRIPLTRLTTRGVLVRVGERFFAISVETIERTLAWEPGSGPTADGEELISIDGELVPITWLAEALDLPAEAAVRMAVVVLRHGGDRRAFAVDEMIGERDFLLQPLPWNLRGVEGIIGGAIMTGGDTVLILDSESLVGRRPRRRAEREVLVTRKGTGSRQRILVVDDSVTSRTLQKIILTSAGFEVLLAVSGEEAWQMIEDGTTVDLVLSDVEMPGLDGIALTKRIRARNDGLPIILVTSLGREEDRRAGADAGADAYIVKGAFDQDELLRAVARLL